MILQIVHHTEVVLEWKPKFTETSVKEKILKEIQELKAIKLVTLKPIGRARLKARISELESIKDIQIIKFDEADIARLLNQIPSGEHIIFLREDYNSDFKYVAVLHIAEGSSINDEKSIMSFKQGLEDFINY